MTTKIIKETLAYTAYDITVYVKINYDKNKISLVEPNGNYGAYKAKQWVFADRGVEYMNGWKNILKAMQEAISFAEQKLLKYQEEEKKAMEDVIMELDKASHKLRGK